MIAVRTFWRIVLTNPPTGADFTSHKDRGIPLFNPALYDEWEGISVYNASKRALYASSMPAFRSHRGIRPPIHPDRC
jgi:hypothetical protein